MMRKLILVSVSIGFAVLLVMARRNAEPQSSSPGENPAPLASAAPAASEEPAAPAAAPKPATAELPTAAWAKFREKFGAELIPRFDENGRLVGIQGRPGQGVRAAPGFDPKDQQQAIARAREILAGASELLGIAAGDELAQPRARGTEISAQVLFKQAVKGSEVAPFGAIDIDLGSQGELVGLSSSFLPGLATANQVTLDSAAARAALASGGITGKVEGVSPVLWVQSPKSAVGAFAYRFSAGGRQVVVDAQSGKIIAQTDPRQF